MGVCMIEYQVCPYCKIRKIKAWEIMCKQCYNEGKQQENEPESDLMEEEWKDDE